MNVFFKIGLPWAATLGVVFFIGLELGSKKMIRITWTLRKFWLEMIMLINQLIPFQPPGIPSRPL